MIGVQFADDRVISHRMEQIGPGGRVVVREEGQVTAGELRAIFAPREPIDPCVVTGED
jgi:hypothetical protein